MPPEDHRNPGVAFDPSWFDAYHVNRSAVERRTATLITRRSIKKEHQAAWLLKAVTMIDLTTLSGDDTPGRVQRICAKARQPIRKSLLEELGFDRELQVASVCVYHNRVRDAAKALKNTSIPVCVVATGFPTGQVPIAFQLTEIEKIIEAGAKEVDIVIRRELVHTGDWQALYDEIKQYREACGDAAHLKTIIEVGELGTLTNVYRASMVCLMAGTDFIKTSTGKAKVNATLENSLVMVRAIRDYHARTGHKVGFKPAGGIRTAKSALNWLILMKEELGDEWLNSSLFRFGASSLLGDIERQLSHHVTGRYAAERYIPMA